MRRVPGAFQDMTPKSASAGAEPSAPVRNYTTPEGHELGRMLAKWCDDAEPAARLRMPELPPRCNSCAFRAGRHLANGSPYTAMDALKCVMEGREFGCHERTRAGQLCSGWAMMMLARDEASFIAVPWVFSEAAPSDTTDRQPQIPGGPK